MCVFQRYTDDGKVVCGSRYYNHLDYQGGLRHNCFFWIKMLIKGFNCPKPYDVENDNEIKILEQDSNNFKWKLKY